MTRRESLFTGHETVRQLARWLRGTPITWAEIGVCCGEGLIWSLSHLRESGVPIRQVWAIDPWGDEADEIARRYDQLTQESALQTFLAAWMRSAATDDLPLHVMVMRGEVAAFQVVPRAPDVAWLDGDHTYESTTLNLTAWWAIAKRAVVVDDYDRRSHPDVCRAVDDHCRDQVIEPVIVGRQAVLIAPLAPGVFGDG